MSVEDLLALFLDSHASAGHSDATIGWYRYQVRRFLAWLVANNLQNGNWLKPEILERYLAESRRAHNAPATVAGHYRALKVFFGWLVRRGYLAESPMGHVQPPKVPKGEPKRAVLGEYVALLDSIKPVSWIGLRDRLIISTLFLCGVRRGECANLRAQDFRIADHVLYVNGKSGPRLVPMLPAVERALVAYLFVRPQWDTDKLFLSANGAGNPNGVILPGGIYQMLRRRCRSAELRMLNPHSFRHGLAMLMLNERGADMSLVQKVLGHSQISTTAKHYAEWLTDGVTREFVEKMRGLGQ
jgi:site-specific recombinase XerD